MQINGYIEYGPTKAINIDYSLSFPATGYFISVNMLFEFSAQGQIIPTRLDVSPYKLSGFADHNETPTLTYDLLKQSLVIYTMYVVYQNLYSLGKPSSTAVFAWEKIFTMKAFVDNLVDLTVIFL